MSKYKLFALTTVVISVTLSCGLFPDVLETSDSNANVSPTPTSLPAKPVVPGESNPDEPVVIRGDIPYTSPFFINTIKQPFVLLEDETGFIKRDREYVFPLSSQVLGPVVINPDDSITYQLSLPEIPEGTYVDLDNDSEQDTGVQVFAVAYWSNVWGGPFLEEREGKGWSTAYTSALVDPANDDEITGGILVVWAPDDNQGFPTGFGEDGLLFTEDDPTAPIPAGYNLVDLNQEPFRVYKESQPDITLNEGVVQVNDYSEMTYEGAFNAMFEKVAREYPFTELKSIVWEDIYEKHLPEFQKASSPEEFYNALRGFSYEIPDGHVNVSLNPDVFFEENGGSFGMVLSELSDGKVIVTQVMPDLPAEKAGIKPGAQIIQWNDEPISKRIDEVKPYFGPYSTDHATRIEQPTFLTRVPPDTEVTIVYKNPGDSEEIEETLKSTVEYDSLFKTIPAFNRDELSLPIEGYVLDDSGLGYVQISTFSDDLNLLARLWDHFIQGLIDEEVPGLIIDMRANGGGETSMVLDFLGYFFDEEIQLYESYYYNEKSGEFESSDRPAKIVPGPQLYEGEIAVLVSPNCVSACEGFSYGLKNTGRAIVLGNYPTAGAFGEVGRGQYSLPEDISMQLPTGRPLSEAGEIIIEGTGVIPDITVPVTEEIALGENDEVLNAAVEALLGKIK